MSKPEILSPVQDNAGCNQQFFTFVRLNQNPDLQDNAGEIIVC